MMKRLPRLGALAVPRRPAAAVAPMRAAAALHTSRAALRGAEKNDHDHDDKPRYKATVVEDDEDVAPQARSQPRPTDSKKTATPKTHSFFEDDDAAAAAEHAYTDERTGSAKRPTVLSRLEHVEEDLHSAEQRGRRLRAEADMLDAAARAARKPIVLPPRRTWAPSADKIAEELEGEGEGEAEEEAAASASAPAGAYKPAEDYEKLPVVGGLGGWFDHKERWGARVKPNAKHFFPPSADQVRERERNKKRRGEGWAGAVATALGEAVEARDGAEARRVVESGMRQGRWMENVKLDDLMLKFDICKRLFGKTGFKVPDAKLTSITTLHELYLLMAGPPAPETLYQTVRAQVRPGHRAGVRAANTAAKEVPADYARPRVMTKGPALLRLPNVRVLPRPLTGVQRERELGRWKVIQREWRARGLPTGANLSHVDKGSEKKWAFGKV